MKIGRNDLCPCGSGLKYKKCCMHADAKDIRATRQISSGPDWVRHFTATITDAAATTMLDVPAVKSAAAQWALADADALTNILFKQHALFDLSVTETGALVTQSPYAIPDTSDEDAIAFKTALGSSCLSLIEVVESKRGKGLRLSDRLVKKDVFVPDAKLAKQLEPLEVIIGRLTDWNGQTVLLPGWEKVRFRGRKAVISLLEKNMSEAGLEDDDHEFRTAWLRREAAATARAFLEA